MLYVHIGCHKTGSSAIQQAFIRNRALLLAQGCEFIADGSGGGVHRLAQGLRGASMQAPLPADSAIAQIAKSKAAVKVISSEAFESASADGVKALRRHLGSQPATVVVYLRRQPDAIQSAYLQQIKRCATRMPFDAWFERFAVGAGGRSRFDYEALIDRWKRAGFADIVVRRYDRALLPDQDVVADFLQSVGQSSDLRKDPRWSAVPDINRSISIAQAEVLRQLWQLHGAVPDDELRKQFDPLVMHFLSTRLSDSSSLLTEAQLALCDQQFAASNQRVAAAFFPSDAALFPEKVYVPRQPMPSSLLAPKQWIAALSFAMKLSAAKPKRADKVAARKAGVAQPTPVKPNKAGAALKAS